MLVALWIVAVLLMLVGLAGVVLPVVPGPPVVFSGILVLAAAYRFERISVGTLVALGLVALLLVAVDIAASAAGTRRFGGTGRGALGAALGGILGLFAGPLGLVAGCLLGAVAGEMLGGKEGREALHAGTGAVIGLLAGAVIKGAACVGMIAAAFAAHFFWNA